MHVVAYIYCLFICYMVLYYIYFPTYLPFISTSLSLPKLSQLNTTKKAQVRKCTTDNMSLYYRWNRTDLFLFI